MTQNSKIWMIALGCKFTKWIGSLTSKNVSVINKKGEGISHQQRRRSLMELTENLPIQSIRFFAHKAMPKIVFWSKRISVLEGVEIARSNRFDKNKTEKWKAGKGERRGEKKKLDDKNILQLVWKINESLWKGMPKVVGRAEGQS